MGSNDSTITSQQQQQQHSGSLKEEEEEDGTSTTDNRQNNMMMKQNEPPHSSGGQVNIEIIDSLKDVHHDEDYTNEDRNSVSEQTNTATDVTNTNTNETNSEYEEIEGYRYGLIIDSDDSTDRAFKELLTRFDKEKDELYLFTATSSFDFLNEEKNNAKLTLFKFQNYLDLLRTQYITIQIERMNLLSGIIESLDENEIDFCFVGSKCLERTINPDNLIYGLFSIVKKTLLGTIVYGLEKESIDNPADHIWKLNVIE
ncbi:hypothetical protein DFA_08268 [Cavenderia fasciculata]|uniref:Uncharacterized protein n=1 Tax=Cavenderia fasciculata TaxID=261658 RepID=F4Q5L6_CACFS|nr:uncharacterized protein DFA_08268 [Cavenderia fasciculata]EGG17275.1 hypothetical protein DFA_08268 [Cavenderia fasciculata]|eukprot:XP_004355759.1 hypothetical protein DFA_08268 [Cavenderia fasciculata]